MTRSENPIAGESNLKTAGDEIVIRANYELFVLVLTLLQVINSLLIVFIRNESAQRIPALINGGLAVFFILDAFYRLWRTRTRRRFLFHFHGYLIFLGSLPIPFSGLLRLVWYRVATVRLRRADYIQMERVVVHKRAQNAMLVIILAAIIVLEASSIFIIQMESGSANANIVTADDAIWWSLVTMATVGYGDYYPVTIGGRLVATFVMVIGVGIFTVMTSFLSHFFLRPRRDVDELQRLGIEPPPVDSGNSIEVLKDLLDQQETAHNATMAEIREKLDMLEKELLKAREKRD